MSDILTKAVAVSLENIPALVDRFYAYLSSEEGTMALQRAADESERLVAKLGATRRIPQELLHAPFTI